MTAGVLLRDYSAGSTYNDPQSNNSTYHRFFAGTYDGVSDVVWTNYEEAIPLGADNAFGGDFDGDGLEDVLSLYSGSFYVALNLGTGSDFGAVTSWSGSAPGSMPGTGFFIADYDGDGKDDVAWYESGMSTYLKVKLSSGTAFGTTNTWNSGFTTPLTETFRMGDFDGDGDDDIIAATWHSGTSHYWWTLFDSNGGTAFSRTQQLDMEVNGMYSFCDLDQHRDIYVGDYDGDGDKEIASRYFKGHQTGMPLAQVNRSDWYVYESESGGSKSLWLTGTTNSWIESVPTGPASYTEQTWQDIRVGDFNDDGADDIFGRDRFGNMRVAMSTAGSYFTDNAWGTFTSGAYQWSDGWRENAHGITPGVGVFVGDFTGDGNADILWVITQVNDYSEVWLTDSSSTTTQMSDLTFDDYVFFDGKRWEDCNGGFGNL